MTQVDIKLILDIIVAIALVFGILLSVSRWAKKKISNMIIKQVDETSVDCPTTQAIKLSRENAKNINQLTTNITNLGIKLDNLGNKMDEYIIFATDNSTSLKRLEIMTLIQTNSNDFLHISNLYDEYKKKGGNSYIDVIFEKYKQDYENDTQG